jgi:hypothetical protein
MKRPIESSPTHLIASTTRTMTTSYLQLGQLGFAAVPIAVAAAALLLAVSPPAEAQTDPKASADEHFKKGVAAFKERRFGDAAPEFEEAYRLSPAYVVLFNIGQVNAALGRSIEAVDAYERFLKQGASAVPAERVREVEAEIAKQLDRIGTVALRTSPEGAEIRLDGKLLGRTPLPRPIRATVGTHTLDVILKGYAPQVQEVDVIGKAERTLNLTLEPDPPPVSAETANAPPSTRALALAPTSPPPLPPAAPPTVTVVEIPRPEPAAAKTPASGASAPINWQRVIGYVAVTGGLGAATVGGLLAYDGWNKTNDARQRLSNATTGAEYDLATPDYDAAKRRTQLGWTVAGIGAAALIAGIIVVVTAPERTANVALTLTPMMASSSNGLALEGVF